MWLIITVVTCVMIQFHITFSCSHHQPQVPTLPLPSCWWMWAFTTTPRRPHHIDHMPHATYHVDVDHATLTPPWQPPPHQLCHMDVNHPTLILATTHWHCHNNYTTSTSTTYPNNNRTWEWTQEEEDEEEMGWGGGGMKQRRGQDSMSHISYVDTDNNISHGDAHHVPCWQGGQHMPCRSPAVSMPTMSTWRMMQATSTPSCINGGTSPFPHPPLL